MPGKSRRRRGKYSFQSKKIKDKPSQPTTLAQQPAVAQAQEPVSPPTTPAPPASVPTPIAKPSAVQYPYIFTELRRIGILSGVMLVILIIIALVLA